MSWSNYGLQLQTDLKRQVGRSVDTDAQCKWTFNDKFFFRRSEYTLLHTRMRKERDALTAHVNGYFYNEMKPFPYERLLGSIHTYDLLSVTYWVNYLLNNGLGFIYIGAKAT